MSEIQVRRVGPEGLPTCHDIRRRVFIDEQRVPEDLEMDDLDASATHFVAWLRDRAVGTARMRSLDPDAKAERVAVLPAERKHGVGKALMREIESEAKRRGLARMVLNSQVSVLPFYERLGYLAQGERFEEAGIPHQRMTKRL